MHVNKSRKIRSYKLKATASLMQCTPIRLLSKNRKAISPVISNLILIAAVLVLGFAALAYARSTSDNYQTQYQQTVSSDINKLKEILAFEYASYSGGNLRVYFMNAGSISTQVDKVYLNTSSSSIPYTLNYMNNTPTSNSTIGVGGERQVVIQQALSSGVYTVRITTIRGSSFAYVFVV